MPTVAFVPACDMPRGTSRYACAVGTGALSNAKARAGKNATPMTSKHNLNLALPCQTRIGTKQ